jgi:hypothetical protein
MYFSDDGVVHGNIYPHLRRDIATSDGVADAKINKDTITKRMTPAQISETQSLARECARKNIKNC